MEEKKHPLFAFINAEHMFNYENGIELTHVEPGLTRGVLHARPSSYNSEGRIHGGAIATLADTIAGCCACSIEYLRAANGDLFCEAAPKKLGRKLSVIQVVVNDTEGKTVATGTFTFYMTRPGET